LVTKAAMPKSCQSLTWAQSNQHVIPTYAMVSHCWHKIDSGNFWQQQK
jgi:hypothetical protein